MKIAPVPTLHTFTINARQVLIRLSDLKSGTFDKFVEKTSEESVYISEHAIIASDDTGLRLLNERMVNFLTRDINESVRVPALVFEPTDALEEMMISFCYGPLTEIRYARTEKQFQSARRFNEPEFSNRGMGKSCVAYNINWRDALQLLVESNALHNAIAQRFFNLPRQELKPKHYEILLSYQIGHQSIDDFFDLDMDA